VDVSRRRSVVISRPTSICLYVDVGSG
jgi:hypothetical protein